MIRLGSVKTQQIFDKSSIQASSNLQLCPLIPEHKVFACLPWIDKVGHGGQLDMVETLMAIAKMIMANGDQQGDDLQLCRCARRWLLLFRKKSRTMSPATSVKPSGSRLSRFQRQQYDDQIV